MYINIKMICFILIFPQRNKMYFLITSNLFLNKNWCCSLIYFDVIFLMQSSDFTKPLNIRSISKKNAKENIKFLICHLRIHFYRYIKKN